MTRRRWWGPTVAFGLASVLAAGVLAGCRGDGGARDEAAAGPPAPGMLAARATPGTHESAIEYGGLARDYLIHVPSSYDGSKAVPLVLVFHGGGGNARHILGLTGFADLAEREGFIAVFPDGTGPLPDVLLTFNAGNCCGPAADALVDDAGFVRALIEALEREYAIDERRVYATGFSNGGMLSYRLACELDDVLAAVAPVSGALNVRECAPEHPVSVLAIHGTDDPTVAYDGGEAVEPADGRPRVDTSVASSVGAFAASNRCRPTPKVERTGDDDAIEVRRWAGCAAGTEVVLYSIEGGRHSWPGGRPEFGGGRFDAGLDATQTIWKFFASHPREPHPNASR